MGETRHLRIAMMPRSKSAPYSAWCREGAQEAARELEVDLVWDGPDEPNPAAQAGMVQNWLDGGFDALVVAASDPHRVSPVLRRAQAHGIPVVAWDSDAEPDARSICVAPVAVDEAGRILADEVANLVDDHGEVAVLADRYGGIFEAFWTRLLEQDPVVKLSAILFDVDDGRRAFGFIRGVVSTCPSIGLVVALSPFSLPGAARAVSLSARSNVRVIGLGLPPSGSRYLADGMVPVMLHWNPQDLGYLTVHVAALLARRALAPNAVSLRAGRLGMRDLCGSEVVLGQLAVTRSR
ncbi:MAG: substrate-binding domain-containing protein [Acidobacteria bacterium]|nr:substrate-binding domain-containing protein [Acidobacteriota bacterium]